MKTAKPGKADGDGSDAPRAGGERTPVASRGVALDPEARTALWSRTIEAVESYFGGVAGERVTPLVDEVTLRESIARFSFERPVPPEEALGFAVEGLRKGGIHTGHPRYFGLFNPASTAMGVAGEALAGALNPQLAAWSYNPFGVEVERHLVRCFAGLFGYDVEAADGTFGAGGSEANHTAMLLALTAAFPRFARDGVRGLDRQPLLYVSRHAHKSYVKAARACGLGSSAVRRIAVDDVLRLDVAALESQLARDRADGHAPFFVAATAGAPFTGAIDPLPELATLAAREGLWLHADAAWAGAAAIVPELAGLLAGIERSDSITFDPHKWLGVPMGAGLLLTRHRRLLARAFSASDAEPDGEADTRDPHLRSLAWSRRFAGLKVFLSLAVAGWDGYRELIRHQVALGDLLRRELVAGDWRLVAPTPLPLVCFVDATLPEGASVPFLRGVAERVVASGDALVNAKRLGERLAALRACVTNYRTGEDDIRALVHLLDEARVSWMRDAAAAHAAGA